MILMEQMGFSYKKKGEPLFENLNLSLQGGSVCGLLGMNGAGKSTLLKLICGGLFAKQGDIDIMGFNPEERVPGLLEEIFYLPEEMDLPAVSGKDYITIFSPFYPRFDFLKMEELCEELEVDSTKGLHRLSHGQRKKFLLAFGIASNSSIMILDEPTNGLDIPSKTLFRKLVAGAVEDHRAIIISTHQVKDVETLIDPVVILHKGRVLFQHSMEEISESLNFQRSNTPPDGSEIFSEAIPGGYGKILPGRGEGALDLELLFNGVIQKGDLIGGSHE